VKKIQVLLNSIH